MPDIMDFFPSKEKQENDALKLRCQQYLQVLRDIKVASDEDDLEGVQEIINNLFGDDE